MTHIFVGIDIAKNLHYASIMNSLGETNMRDAKNDKIDSLLVCTALSLRLKTQITLDDTLVELRDICQEYRDITNKISTSKIQLITHLDKAIPELAKLFKASIHGKAVYALLKAYPLPAKIKESELTN